jgi:hypothetical protein
MGDKRMRDLLARCVYSMGACVGLLLASMAQGADPTAEPVEAVWRPLRVEFIYRSQGQFYRCELLEYKIKGILRELGAREPLELRRLSCSDFAGFARFEVLMESPVIATEENIRAITSYQSEDILIARVKGVELPSSADLQRFPAVWELVRLRHMRSPMLQDTDCALVQQLRRQVLPKMSIQIVRDTGKVDCTQARPRLTVLALIAHVPD